MQDRWRLRYASFQKALAQLSSAAAIADSRPLSPLEQQGLIQGFEIVQELSWKVIKDWLDAEGLTGMIGSKSAIREALRTGLLDDGDVWMTMIDQRNLSSHVYDEAFATELVSQILQTFLPQFKWLADKLGKLS